MKPKIIYYVEVVYRDGRKTEWYRFPKKRILDKFIKVWNDDFNNTLLRIHEVKE